MSKPAKVVEITATDLAPMGIPAKSIRIDLGPERRGFVFTVSSKQRAEMAPDRLNQLAQSLGNLVHPSSAILIVIPEGNLGAYAVELA